MRKLLALMLAAGMVLSCSVVIAEQETKVEGALTENTLTVTYNEGERNVATLTIFDEGVLVGTKTTRFENDCYTFELSDDDVDKDMRIYFYESETYAVNVVEITVEPTETPTEVPAETETTKPVRTPYPEAYEKPLDAINAPAVVKDVQTVVVDGELYYELTLLHQGREFVTNVREKVLVASAPANMTSVVGEKTDCLKAGDVIHVTSDLQGRVRSIEFIYRPEFTNYFYEGISVDNVIGNDGWSEFVFGVAVETYSDAMEIMDGEGNIYDLAVSPAAFVYGVSYGRKGAVTDLYGKGARSVPRVRIPDANLEDEAHLWDGMEEMPYVLARVSRGIVTDIIVFE